MITLEMNISLRYRLGNANYTGKLDNDSAFHESKPVGKHSPLQEKM
jgi:hypothetical protein